MVLKFMLHLEQDDFKIINQKENSVLITSITSGPSIILFYGNNSKWCDIVKPIFQKLVMAVNCQLGMVNLSKNISIISHSQNTSTPITYVPFIVFYVDGFPHSFYEGEYTFENLKKFANDLVSQTIAIRKLNVWTKQKKISTYSEGNVIINGNKNYLNIF